MVETRSITGPLDGRFIESRSMALIHLSRTLHGKESLIILGDVICRNELESNDLHRGADKDDIDITIIRCSVQIEESVSTKM